MGESHHKQNTGCITIVALLMAKALAVIAWKSDFRGDVRLRRDSQAAEFVQRSHFRHFWSLRYPHNTVRC